MKNLANNTKIQEKFNYLENKYHQKIHIDEISFLVILGLTSCKFGSMNIFISVDYAQQ